MFFRTNSSKRIAGKHPWWSLLAAVLGMLALGQSGYAATPVASDMAMVYAYGTASVSAAAPVTDPGDTMTITITAQPTDGVVSVSGTNLTFTPTGGASAVFATVNTFTYQACDQNALCASANGTVVQSCPAPVISASSSSPSSPNSAIGGTISATYTASACVTNAVLKTDLLQNSVIKQTLTKTVDAFGTGQVAVVGTFAPTAAATYTFKTYLDADYRTGAISGGVPVTTHYVANKMGFYVVSNAVPPAAPTNVSATDGTAPPGDIIISWTAAPTATHYDVSRTPALGGATVTVVSGTSNTSYVDVVPDTATYNYSVLSRIGGLNGAWSTSDAGYAAAAVVVPVPTGVAATQGTLPGVVRVTWDAVVGATQYGVGRYTQGIRNRLDFVNVAGGTLFADMSVVEDGTVFDFTVMAAISGTSGNESAPVTGFSASAPLVAPTGVSATDGTLADVIRVTWSAVTGATSYDVTRTPTSGGASVQVASGLTTTTFDDAVTLSTSYDYTVRTYVGGVTSAYSAADAGYATITPPAAPIGVAATDGTVVGAIRVTWNAVAGATSYEVARTPTAGGATVVVGTGLTATTYDDVVSDATSYNYEVRALKGVTQGVYSTADSGYAGVAPPAAPTGVTATDGTLTGVIRITWNPVLEATSYDVARAPTAGGASVTVATGVTATTLDDTVGDATSYDYTVRAVKGGLAGAYSTADSGFAAVPPLAAPAGVSATDGTLIDTIRITWSAVLGATGYEVARTPAGGGATVIVATGLAGTTYDDVVGNAASYNYEVRALNGAAPGLYSAADSGYAGVAAAGATWTWREPIHSLTFSTTSNTCAAVLPAFVSAMNGLYPGQISAAASCGECINGLMTVGATQQFCDQSGGRQVWAGTLLDYTDNTIPPAVPGGLTVSSGQFTDMIRVTWNTVPGATSYDVERTPAAGGVSVTVATGGAGLSLDDPVVDGATYNYTVRAVKGSLPGAYSAAVGGYAVVSPPAAPIGVAATDGTLVGKVRITWNAVALANTYDVVRTPTAGGVAVTVATGLAATSFDDTLSDSTSYDYTVRAVKSGAPGAYSVADSGYAIEPPLPAPTGVSATDGTIAGIVRITWDAVPTADTYFVQRAPAGGGAVVEIAANLAGVSYDDALGDDVTVYNYTVTAKHGSVIGTESVADSGYALLPPPPAAPANVKASRGLYSDKIRVTWDAVAGATSYSISRAPASGGAAVEVAASVQALLYDDLLATDITVYNYTVTAKRGAIAGTASTADSGHVVRLPQMIANQWSATAAESTVTVSLLNAADANCMLGTQSEASQNASLCFAQWTSIPVGLSQTVNAADPIPPLSGTPTQAGNHTVSAAFYRYDSAVPVLLGEVTHALTVASGPVTTFSFTGSLSVKRLIQDVNIVMKQSGGTQCLITTDAAEAAARARRSRSCLVSFATLPAGLSTKKSLIGDKIAIIGRAAQEGVTDSTYTVSRVNQDGTSVALTTGTLSFDIQVPIVPTATFTPLKQTGVADQYQFAPKGALGRLTITQADAGLLKMEVLVDDVVVQSRSNLRRGNAQYVLPPTSMGVWESKLVKARVSYQSDPTIYTDVGVTAVAGPPQKLVFKLSAPPTAVDTNGDVKFDIEIGTPVSGLLSADAQIIGNWKVYLAKYEGRPRVIVPISDPVTLVAGKGSIMMPPVGTSISAFAVGEPVLPVGLSVNNAQILSPMRTVIIQKGDPIVGTMTVTYKRTVGRTGATGAYAFMTVALDMANRAAMKSFTWSTSTDGVLWTREDAKVLTRAVQVLPEAHFYKVEFVNRYSNATSETAPVEINMAALPAVAGQVASASSVNSDPLVPTGAADKPIALKMYPSNTTLRAPVVLALQSLTNTGSGVYDWDVNGTLVPNQHTYKATVNLELPGTYIIRARSGRDGEFEGVQTVTVIANQVPVCTLDPQPVVGGLRVVANCADPDGRLRGWQWSLNGRDLSTIGSSLLVPLKAGEQALVGIRVWDDSRGEAQFSRTVSMQ